MRHYEVVFLVHEDRVDEIESVKTKVEGSFLDLIFSFSFKLLIASKYYEHHLRILGTL